MKLSHGGHSTNAHASQLSELLAFAREYVNEAVHVADTESLNAILWLQLPLRTKTGMS